MTIPELISITSELNTVLDQVTKNNREESIKAITEIIDNRERILKQLDGSMVKNDLRVKQLLLDEEEIKNKMQALLYDIKKDIQVVSQKKTSGAKYINPYKNLFINGAFLDKKK